MGLSFSLETKEELARVKNRRSCCARAELVAFLRQGKGRILTMGTATGTPGGVNHPAGDPGGAILLATGHAAVARRIYSLARAVADLGVKVKTERRARGGRPIYKVITAAGLETINTWLAGWSAVPEYRCCLAAYLRGAFLAAGSANRPAATHHLEFLVEEEGEAGRLQAVMEQLQLQPRLSRRQRGLVLYLKDSEEIIRALSLMGAHNAVLVYENVRILKDMRNQVNRLVNCETANLSKTVETGLRQAEKIRYLMATAGWERLPASLREIARLRLEYPEASFKELGAMLVPPVGKSGVNHRLRRLEFLARQMRARGGE